MSQPVTLVLVDDHAVVREALAASLHRVDGLDVVGQAGTPERAAEAVARTRPGVLVLDLRLGTGDPGTLVARCKASSPATRVLILSAWAGTEDVRDAVRAGADGYVLKGSDTRQLVDAIHRVACGEQVIDTDLVPAVLGELLREPEPDPEPLTPREHEVLALLVAGSTSREVASTLGTSVRTVQKHTQHLHRKLGVGTRAGLVREALHRGLA